MDFSKQYFTIIGAELEGLTGFIIGPVMTEQEIIDVANSNDANILSASPQYDGEQFDAALEFLNDNGRILEIFECETSAEDFVCRAAELGAGWDARQTAAGWLARKVTLQAAH